MFFSAAVGYAIVVGSSILKVPQIVNVVRSQSAEGISLASILLECAMYSTSASWGLARGVDFKDYGESIIIMCQMVFLVTIVSFFSQRFRLAALVLGAILGINGAFAMRMLPKVLHEGMLAAQTVVLISSRLPQIYMNYRRRATGQLSFLTYFLALGGGCARCMTVLLNVSVEQGKYPLFCQQAIAAVLSATIVSQILYYGPKGRVAVGKSEKKN